MKHYTAYRLSTEFFAIPYQQDTYILYSPLTQIVVLANQDMVDMVASLRDGTLPGATGANMDALQLLIESGAVNGPEDQPPNFQRRGDWKPTEVTVFLTNACNLRCSYCYASAGDYKGSLDRATALAAVELVVRNTLELGQQEFRVSYHGGGEPTLAWDTLTASALRAEELAKRHGLKVALNLATNGVLPSWKVDWVARHIHDFSISYDGPAWAQDRQRPTMTGAGSAETVEATLRHLDSHAARYGVRLTVTEETVLRLADIVAYLLKRYSPSTIHLEPLFSHGRAHAKGLAAPQAWAFIENYREAERVARQYGLELYYSGARLDTVTDTFCGVPEGSFNVTPEGLLTSCFEVCHPDDHLADKFFYGGRDASTGVFTVDQAKLQTLAGHTVRERPECQDCFCKWHCAGDCIAKNMTSDDRPRDRLKAARCLINQELTRDQLVRRLEQNSTVMMQIKAMSDSALIPLGPAEPIEPVPIQEPHAPQPLVQIGLLHATR
ncbi:MAG: radical SAM protein [Planctomycetes bacterium]|nr:radical SAM protein [Planctomycetota bacterium]